MSTLSTPEDLNAPPSVNANAPVLADEQASEALKELNKNEFIGKFPQVERRFVDPVVDHQMIGLISFVPAKGATPNERGIYGFAKLRGNFATPQEANLHAEELIRKVDSYNPIYHAFVGRPFPLTTSSDFSKEVNKVDLQKEISKSLSEDVKSKREREQREIEEMKQREQELLADVKKEREDTHDHYTTLHVKNAQLKWTYVETEKKMKQMVTSIAKTRREIELLDAEDPSLREMYMKKYMDARKQAGLSMDNASDSFMKYLVEDIPIPVVDEEYRVLYGDVSK
jgi:hypothetical protein